MTSRERVTRAITFQRPDRIPVRFGYFGIDDTYFLKWKQIGAGDETQRQSYDEWGCRWERSEQNNMGQIKYHPLEDWAAYDTFVFPDPNDPALYEDMERLLDENAGDKYVFVEIFMLLFERLHSLRGFSNVLIDLYEEPEKLGELADRIVEYDIEIIHNIQRRFPGRIQGFSCTDDWGTETNTFISTDMWNEFFRPRYQKIFDACREDGWHIWLHSCGKITNFMDGFIGLGIDVLNLQQPRVLDIENFGKKYAGKVCFATLCDIQRTLPFGSEEDIRSEVRELCRWWATPKGGLILMDDGNGPALGISDENRRIMLDEFMKQNPYSGGEPDGQEMEH